MTKKRKPKHISELSKKNARKAQVLEYFSRRDWTLPKVAVTTLGLNPGSGWYYLKRMYTRKYLRRGKDVRGALVYKLAPKGSAWLLRQKQLKREAERAQYKLKKEISSLYEENNHTQGKA